MLDPSQNKKALTRGTFGSSFHKQKAFLKTFRSRNTRLEVRWTRPQRDERDDGEARDNPRCCHSLQKFNIATEHIQGTTYEPWEIFNKETNSRTEA